MTICVGHIPVCSSLCHLPYELGEEFNGIQDLSELRWEPKRPIFRANPLPGSSQCLAESAESWSMIESDYGGNSLRANDRSDRWWGKSSRWDMYITHLWSFMYLWWSVDSSDTSCCNHPHERLFPPWRMCHWRISRKFAKLGCDHQVFCCKCNSQTRFIYMNSLWPTTWSQPVLDQMMKPPAGTDT